MEYRKPNKRYGLVQRLRVQSRDLSNKLGMEDLKDSKIRVRADMIIHKTIDATVLRQKIRSNAMSLCSMFGTLSPEILKQSSSPVLEKSIFNRATVDNTLS